VSLITFTVSALCTTVPGQLLSAAVDSVNCTLSQYMVARGQSVQLMTKDGQWFEFKAANPGHEMLVALSPLNNPPPWYEGGALLYPADCCCPYYYWSYPRYIQPGGGECYQWGLRFEETDLTFQIEDGWRSGPGGTNPGGAQAGNGRESFPMPYDANTIFRFTRVGGQIVLNVNGVTIYTYARPASATDDFAGNLGYPWTGFYPNGNPVINTSFAPTSPGSALRLVMNSGGNIDNLPPQPGILVASTNIAPEITGCFGG
jgi:hypothetical protein